MGGGVAMIYLRYVCRFQQFFPRLWEYQISRDHVDIYMQVVFDSCWRANLVNPGSRGVFLAACSHAAFAELFYETHAQRSLLSTVAVSKNESKSTLSMDYTANEP